MVRVIGRRRLPWIILGLMMVAGCNESPIDPEPTLELLIEAPLERGLRNQLTLRRDDRPVGASEVMWSVTPTGAASLHPDGSIVPLRMGELTFTASLNDRTASVTATVAAPPVVVFDRFVDGNRDIWAVALDGEDIRRLTTHSSHDSDPSSAAGIVTFVSYRNGSADLYSVPLDGGDERRLTTGARNEASPSMSSDGRRVVYTSDLTIVTKLWTLDMETLATNTLTVNASDSGDIHASPDWWGASDSIAFVTTARGSADIDIVRVSSGDTEIAVAAPGPDVEPAVSPDGRKLVFVSTRDGNDELYLTTLETGETRRLTNRAGSDANPAWLPDGRIVYVAMEGTASALYWLDPEDPAHVHAIPGTEGARNPSGT